VKQPPSQRVLAYAMFVAHTLVYLQAFKLVHHDQGARRRRLQVRGMVRADRLIGRGVVPTARLQRLRRRPRVRAVLDRALGAVYFAWAPQRHVALLWLLWRHPREFPRAAAIVCATFDTTLAVHAAVPTAPPWWAAKYGLLQDPLHRVTIDASDALPLVPHESAVAAEEANPWASTPSNHVASATALAFALAEVDPRAGAIGAGYAAVLGLAVVYLGEHYVVDVIGGVATAVAVVGAARMGR
jgi:membrane-associated phospholipid phosphatase